MDWTEVPLQDNGHFNAGSTPTSAYIVVEALESGFGALVVWCAGPDHALRSPATDASQRRVTLDSTGPDGRQNRTSRPFTDADRTAIDEDINAYLEAAGIQPRPSGFRWFIRIPDSSADPKDFWSRLNVELAREAPTARYPAEVRRAIENVLPRVLTPPGGNQ